MEYIYKAHETKYADVLFRSRLEATWAAFFDLIEWKWEYEPLDLQGWTPDFIVRIPCGHSECGGDHVLLIEVKPYYNIEQFKGHPCMKYPYGQSEDGQQNIPADASAAFGNNWEIVEWEMSHGSGGGAENNIADWTPVSNLERLWKKAGNTTQYKAEKQNS